MEFDALGMESFFPLLFCISGGLGHVLMKCYNRGNIYKLKT